jgi:hypothetical protein
VTDNRWEIIFAAGLVALSVLLYAVHFTIFEDLHHILIYFVGDVAFVPIEVLLVTLIIHRLLESRDRRQKMEKLNMVIGTFFSALGTELLAFLSDRDPRLDEIRGELVVSDDWSDAEFDRVVRRLAAYAARVAIGNDDFVRLKAFLAAKEEILIRMLENPTLLEHESFTELLRAVFHLTEELQKRQDFGTLPPADLAHLEGDIVRVYGLLIREWLDYMRYLRGRYPYLFSLAMRTNPFDETATVVVAA